MKDTPEESADLKQRLKKELETPELTAEANRFPLEADEAYFEVREGRDYCVTASWVSNRRPADTAPFLDERPAP